MGRRYEALHHRHSHEKKDVRSRQVRTHVHTTGEKAQRKANATAAKQLTRTAGKESNPHPPATSAEVKVEESGEEHRSLGWERGKGRAENLHTCPSPRTTAKRRFFRSEGEGGPSACVCVWVGGWMGGGHKL
eukprot:RCo035981